MYLKPMNQIGKIMRQYGNNLSYCIRVLASVRNDWTKAISLMVTAFVSQHMIEFIQLLGSTDQRMIFDEGVCEIVVTKEEIANDFDAIEQRYIKFCATKIGDHID